MAKAFEREDCPICGRSDTSMTEGKKVSNPDYYKTLHIWFPDWIVVCRSCHNRVEGKPATEWKRSTGEVSRKP